MSRRDPLLAEALSAARETRALEIGRGAIDRAATLFQSHFGAQPAAIVADANTFEAAGRHVYDVLQSAGIPCVAPFIYEDPAVYAEYPFVETLTTWLRQRGGIPVAVGAGTINDLTKLAAHEVGCPYLAIPTAASTDGYTAFGASITYQGSRLTFDGSAPQAVVADLDVLAAAPPLLNAAGYGDLLARITSGADWLVADALGEEPLEPRAWELVQGSVHAAAGDPEGIRRGDPDAIYALIRGLLLCGFAMQWTRTRRPASGAEHQFSHLWDMEDPAHEGRAPAHGFRVGIATVAVSRLYELLLTLPLEDLSVERSCRAWPDERQTEQAIRELFRTDELRAKAREETAAKWIDRERLRSQLDALKEIWPHLRERVRQQVIPAGEVRQRLEAAGAPSQPEEISITQDRLRASHRKAYHLSRRFTVLDLTVRAGLLEPCLQQLYPDGGLGS